MLQEDVVLIRLFETLKNSKLNKNWEENKWVDLNFIQRVKNEREKFPIQ